MSDGHITLPTILESISSRECPSCRKFKPSGKPFCRDCYTALPYHLRDAMTYSPANNPHLEAEWNEAMEVLTV
jgi:hypothetical protein